MAGIITITLPFGGGFTVSTSGPAATNSGAGSNASFNWSGYQATSGVFTAVSGTWTIPAVASATSTQADATWIGIGGVSSRDLIQAGTQAVINGSGAPAYEAWYETLPASTTQVPLTVSPGDSMSASLSETSPASGATTAEWLVTIRDNTTGQSYQTSIAYNSSLSSAEWIEEMPSDGSRPVPLDNFGSVLFINGTTIQNGIQQTIAGANAQPLTMVNGTGQVLVAPSALGGNATGFSVTRTSASPTQSSGGFGRGGLGRGWRRTGVGVERFNPQPTQTVPTSSAYGQRWLKILQQFQQLRQQFQLRG